jgi:molybdopterin/thiamine biosynthesis adenylyltransferase
VIDDGTTLGSHLMLDVLLPALEGFNGIVYGLRSETRNRVILSRTEAVPGLVPLAATFPGTVLPELRRTGEGAWVIVCGGREEEVEIVRWSTDFGQRQQGLIDLSVIGKKRAAIVGLGSVGFPIAIHLARAGIGGLIFVDTDTVALTNLSRTGFAVADLDRPKVEVARDRSLTANPRLIARAYAMSIEQMLDEEPDVLDDVDLIVAAASNAVGFALAAQFHRKIPIIFPALHARGASGELFVSLGAACPEAPCFSCFRARVRLPQAARRTWNYAADDGELHAEPALGADVAHVTSIAASVATNILGDTCDRVLDSAKGQLLLVANRRGVFPDGSFATQWARVPRDPECPNHDESDVYDAVDATAVAELPEVG